MTGSAAIELLWIPLGTGACVVRASGRAFEAASAVLQRRSACDLYHSAIIIEVPAGRFVIEMAPIPDSDGAARGAVVEGPVGMRWAARFRVFRYEVRCWRDGVIPDADRAVEVIRWDVDAGVGQRIVQLAPSLPTPVWGRDELRAGEMWNSNSITAWLLTKAGIDTASIRMPNGGRAPGWNAGLVVAARQPAAAEPGHVSAVPNFREQGRTY